MASNVLRLFAVALVAIQLVRSDYFVRDYHQQAQQAVSNLNKIVTDRIHDSTEDIETELENVRNFAKNSIKTTSVLIENTVSNSLDTIRVAKENAIEQGKDPSGCIGTAEDDIRNIPVNTVNDMVNCINVQLTSAEDTVAKTSEQMRAILKTVFALENKLGDCAVATISNQCYLEVLSTATQQTATLPGKIVTLEIGCTKKLDANTEEIAVCSFSRAADVQHNVTVQAQEIVECIEKL